MDGDSRKWPAKYQTETSTLTGRLFVANSVTGVHTFLVTLLRQFDFSLPDDGPEIKTMGQGLISPVVVGEEHKGPQMPLKVTLLGNE